jgi:hypothetical protein
VKHLGNFETPSSHIAHQTSRPVETGDNTERCEVCFLRPAEDTHRKAGFAVDRRYKLSSVRSVADSLGGDGIDATNAHSVGHGPEPPGRRKSPLAALGREFVRLIQAGAQPAQRLLVKPWEWRTRKTLVNDETHRVRTDVHDGVVSSARPCVKFHRLLAFDLSVA